VSKKKSFQSFFPNANDIALDFLRRLLVFNPHHRLTVEEALKHKYVEQFSSPEEEFECDHVIKIDLDDNIKLSVKEYRDAIYADIAKKKKEQRRRLQEKYLSQLGITPEMLEQQKLAQQQQQQQAQQIEKQQQQQQQQQLEKQQQQQRQQRQQQSQQVQSQAVPRKADTSSPSMTNNPRNVQSSTGNTRSSVKEEEKYNGYGMEKKQPVYSSSTKDALYAQQEAAKRPDSRQSKAGAGTSSNYSTGQSTASSGVNGSGSGSNYAYGSKPGSSYGSYGSGDVKQSASGMVGGTNYGKAPVKTTTASSILKKK